MSRDKNKPIQKNLANIVTGIRIICSLVMIFCPTLSLWFYIFYIIAALSDLLDGVVARKMNIKTKLGAKLDTTADILFTGVVLIKVIFAFQISIWIIAVTIGVAVLKCVNVLIGFGKYRRFMSEHTILNKLCGGILFVIPISMGLLSYKVTLILMSLECILAIVAAIYESYLIWIGKEVD